MENLGNSEDLMAVTVHALAGYSNPQTMKVSGYLKRQSVTVLIDTGSTNNFLDEDVAKRLSIPVEPCDQFEVKLADGRTLTCQGKCSRAKLLVQDQELRADFFLLPLGDYEVVLGIEWLRTLGDVLWNFSKLTMKFTLNGQRVTFRGKRGGSVTTVSSHRMERILKKERQGYLLQLKHEEAEVSDQARPEIESLLEEFEDIFSEPKTLPPKRAHDHHIPLLPGSAPTNVRPYRYPYFQKAEIEKIVKEMRDSGIIRPSVSPYSSPVLLVRKKDGSWRMCVDYRALNRITVKDKYPIPVIDELLDELGGAQHFSKLDLRSGYHQIRVHEDDIQKTAFRTHDGHYEFLVMPFGLTNAPSTFQSLMNDIFRPYLRKFVLIFFYDILIYSSSMEDHLEHLRLVFTILREHSLFVKKSKCSFARAEVEYLGHIVSRDGMAADPSKIQAMVNWPMPKTIKALRGFLGLTGYYRKFVQDYGKISAPLTALLKKDAFQWNDVADEAFARLKWAMTTTPVLALPDFNKMFILECDASGLGIGAVLMQEGRPIAFTSKALSPLHLSLSVYDKEMLAIIHAVAKWRPYLIGRRFQIRTDHKSLKYILEQRISSMEQQKWVSKLQPRAHTESNFFFKKKESPYYQDRL
jgi:hypothetical protein